MITVDKDCTCSQCVSACERQPGWLKPGEAEKIARFLNVDFSEIESRLILDHCDNGGAENAPYVYAPRKVGVDLPEEKIRNHYSQRARGPCTFLKDERCSIHPVKPYECRKAFACTFKRGLRDDIEEAWIAAGAPLGMRPETSYD